MPHGSRRHQPEAHAEAELISALEPDQLTAASNLPLPPAQMSFALTVALLLLRIFALLITAIVVFVFIMQLRATP